MKIVFLSHFDANLYLFRLPIMKALAQQGWEVIALCPEGDYSAKFEAEGVRHVPYPIDRGSLNPLKEFRSLLAISARLKELAPDILHTFTVKPNIYGNIAGILAGTKVRVSSVTGLGSFFIENDFKSKIVRTLISFLYRLLFKFTDRVIFQNGDDRELFINKKIVSREKTVLIKGSGIDTTLWKRDVDGHEKPLKTVLFIGRLLIHKGVREFIEAAKIVTSKREDVRFVIAGDYYAGNPYNIERSLLDGAVEEGSVEFLGWREDIRELLNATTIFVLPSYREGMPRTAIEAASMGIPVITTDAVGCKEVVEEGVNGFLVPVGESRLIAERIESLLDNEELYRKMAVNGRKKAETEFDASVIVSRHLELYKSLLKEF